MKRFARIATLGLLGACSGSGSGQPGAGADANQAPAADAALALDGGGLGAPDFGNGELDPPSHGGTITFTSIGAAGWYPSRRDPAIGPCDAYQTGTCCLAHHEVTSDALTPWHEDLVLTLRGPLELKQLAVYQPDGARWSLVSAWDSRQPARAGGLSFHGKGAFGGTVGSECLVDVATNRAFACGPGSSPYCPTGGEDRLGWTGSKLYVLLATMRHATDVGGACSTGTAGNWYDAPWLGLSLGELVRAGSFSDCQCYAKDPTMWWLGDGCGQFNVFEVVNDNNASKNLDVFSTNFFGYAGYVGEGPCGPACGVATLDGAVDLIDKAHDTEAAAGALASPTGGPGAAFRRPERGYRYFMVLLDVPSRTVQLAIVHPQNIPAGIAGLLPDLPGSITEETVAQLRSLRLPH